MSDSFLPSGGVEIPPQTFPHLSSQTSPSSAGIPPLNNTLLLQSISDNSTPSPKTYVPSQSQNPHGPPLSPPKTRSPSAETASAAMIEDWRAYTTKLRRQNEGERAHMAADRARIEEVMEEERKLWDQERKMLNARIEELEAQLQRSTSTVSPPAGFLVSTIAERTSISGTKPHPMSVGSSRDSSSSHSVPQESGRDENGNAFYAPAPRNPSRTFDTSESNDLRVDSISEPRETPIRVTSKELTPSDFIRSPPTTSDLEPNREVISDGIDISRIAPGLEGVSIRASAVSPEFAARVWSPAFSPPKVSPNTRAPPRDITNHGRLGRSFSNPSRRTARSALDVTNEAENRRLKLHAGHTPNASIFVLPWATEEDSGNVTPRQAPAETVHRPSVAPTSENVPLVEEPTVSDKVDQVSSEDTTKSNSNGDRELSGPLGFTNNPGPNDAFFATLVEKLEEAKKSQPTTPDESTSSSRKSSQDIQVQEIEKDAKDDEDIDGVPRLRYKLSTNFGRPLGRI